MNDIESTVRQILGNRNRVKSLLILEKQRRNLPETALVFLGIGDVAKYWWCAQEAVFKNRDKELFSFGSYLSDRIEFAHRLGLVTDLSNTDEALLDVGNQITLEQVEQLLKKDAVAADRHAHRQAGVQVPWLSEDRVDKDGTRKRLINPDSSPEEKNRLQELAVEEGVPLIDLEHDPTRRGEIYEAFRAEKYLRIRWHFPWRRYCIVGIPDGLTPEFAYEYKTTRTRFLMRFMKPVAIAQADLYSHFFQRPSKRVQILVVEENVTETFEEAADTSRALATLAAFARVDEGEPAHPPVPWKCRPCDFRTTCPISQAK